MVNFSVNFSYGCPSPFNFFPSFNFLYQFFIKSIIFNCANIVQHNACGYDINHVSQWYICLLHNDFPSAFKILKAHSTHIQVEIWMKFQWTLHDCNPSTYALNGQYAQGYIKYAQSPIYLYIFSYTISPNLWKFEKSPIMHVSYTSRFIISKHTFCVNNTLKETKWNDFQQ